MEKESLKALENAREIRNPNLGQDHEREQRVQVNAMQNTAEFNLLEEVRKNLNDYESNTEQSKNNDIRPYKGENDEEVEGSGLKSDIYLQIAENSSEIKMDKTTHIADMVELEHLEEKKSNLEENDSLSVVLEESLTSSLPEPDEQQNLLNLEREEAASVQQELEEATTLTTEQTEHIVIKKVLDMRDILEMQPGIAETTLPLEEKEENGNYANPVEPNDLEFVTGKIKAQESVEENSQEEVKKYVNEVEWGSGVGEDSYNKFASWPEEADSFNKKNHKNIKDFEDLSDSSQNNLESNSDDQSHVLSTEKIEIHKSNETDNQILIWPTNEALNSNEKEASEEVINGRTEEVTAIPPEYEENEKEQETLTESQIYLKSEEPESLSQDTSSQLEQDNEKANSLQDEHLRVQDDFNIKQEGDEKDSFWLPTTEYLSPQSTENVLINAHMAVTPLGIDLFTHDIRSTTENSLDIEYSSRTAKGSRSINTAINQRTATLFETYPPHDAGQTFNNNLAAETSSGIGKALPVSINDGTSRSTVIIILSSGTAFLFIIVSVTIFLISFQRQHGTLDIEMQERNCGKDNLDEEDAETFTKLLEIELPSQVAVALEETEECL